MQTKSDNEEMDFFDIPMDGINELNKYLSQAVEKV